MNHAIFQSDEGDWHFLENLAKSIKDFWRFFFYYYLDPGLVKNFYYL